MTTEWLKMRLMKDKDIFHYAYVQIINAWATDDTVLTSTQAYDIKFSSHRVQFLSCIFCNF